MLQLLPSVSRPFFRLYLLHLPFGVSHLSLSFKSLSQISPSSPFYFSLSFPISVSPIFSSLLSPSLSATYSAPPPPPHPPGEGRGLRPQAPPFFLQWGKWLGREGEKEGEGEMGTHGVCGPIQRIIHGLERGRDKETETQRHGESIPRRRHADRAGWGK